MKKTLIITLEYPPTIGGIATYVHDLARTLDPEKTIVLAPHHPDEKQWDAKQKYTVIRETVLYPKFIWPRWLKLIRIVKKIAKQHKIELVMIHHMLPVGYAGIRMKRKKIPFLLFSHGTDLIAGTATAWKKRMVTRVSEAAEQIIFNSESLKRRYLRALPQFEEKSLVLYPCPDPEFLDPPPASEVEALRTRYALQGKQVMLSVSRLADGKGFPHLVRMMPDIIKKAPHVVWMIVGDGPKKELILEEIQKRNLQNVVRFVGQVPHEAMRVYYYLADLFVLLTHPDEGKEEGLGLVFLEAAAAGLPVIAGRSGGVEEAVLDGKTGMVFDLQAQAREIPAAIGDLLKDTAREKELGENAQARIRSNFQWEYQIDKLRPWLME